MEGEADDMCLCFVLHKYVQSRLIWYFRVAYQIFLFVPHKHIFVTSLARILFFCDGFSEFFVYL